MNWLKEAGKWLWLYRSPIVVGALVGAAIMYGLYAYARWVDFSAGEFLALGQLVTDLLMVPVAVWGFLFIIREFQKSEAKPKVDLYFDNGTKELKVTAPSEETIRIKDTLFALVLINNGSALARWYSVEITIPYIVEGDLVLFDTLSASRMVGRWTVQNGDGCIIWNFWSDGETALYLEQPTIIHDWYLRVGYYAGHEDKYEVPYKISSDWSKPVRGTLVIRVVNSKE